MYNYVTHNDNNRAKDVYSSNDPKSGSSSPEEDTAVQEISKFLQVLHDLRNWTSKSITTYSGSDQRAQVVVLPMDIRITKEPSGYANQQVVQLEAFGIQLRLPLTDETLCHAAALVLGKRASMYH